MKKVMFTLLAGLVFSMGIQAQDIPQRKREGWQGQSPRHQRMQKHRHLQQQLNLTEAQKEQFKTEREAFRQKMEELKKNENITVKEWKARQQKIRQDHQDRMQNILTPEQKNKVKELREKAETRKKEMADRRFDHLKTRLALTEQQSADLQKSRLQLEQELKALRENKSLTPELRREKVKAIMKQHQEKMKSVLTEEQKEKMKELRKQGPKRGPGRPSAPREKQTI